MTFHGDIFLHSQLDRWVRWQRGYDMGIVYAVGQNFLTLVQMDGLGIWFGLGHELLTFRFYASTCLPIGLLVVCDIAVMLVKPCLHIHQLWFPLNIPYVYIYTYLIAVYMKYVHTVTCLLLTCLGYFTNWGLSALGRAGDSVRRLDGSRPGRRYWTMWCLLFAR